MAERTGRPPHTLVPPPWDNPSPDWDRIDQLMMEAWWLAKALECPGCGRPSAVHETDSPDDYDVWQLDCTAMRAIGEHVALLSGGSRDAMSDELRRLAADDAARRDRRQDPEWSRRYVARTPEEGPPKTTL
jgi:hypothetical protein